MVNNVSLVGRLAGKPELRTTPEGTSVTSFTVVIDRPRVKEDGSREADFIAVTAWRRTAEFVSKHFEKGDYISVVGSIQTKIRTTKDGASFKTTEVLADRCDFCGYRRPREE